MNTKTNQDIQKEISNNPETVEKSSNEKAGKLFKKGLYFLSHPKGSSADHMTKVFITL